MSAESTKATYSPCKFNTARKGMHQVLENESIEQEKKIKSDEPVLQIVANTFRQSLDEGSKYWHMLSTYCLST